MTSVADIAIAREPIRLPAAAATRFFGVTLATTWAAAGDDVERAVGFVDARQRIAFALDTPGGLYLATIRARATAGAKAFELGVDGLAYAGVFRTTTQLVDHALGPIELPAGKAEVTLGGGWGHYEIAGLTLTPVDVDPPPPRPSTTLVNPRASPEARDVFRRLIATYGEQTLSGVSEFDDVGYVRERAGHAVAIVSRDLIEYSPSRIERGGRPGDMTERLIAESRAGRIASLCWHWNAPGGLLDAVEQLPDGQSIDKRWYRGFYANATTFDYATALDDEQGVDHALMRRDVDAIAVELKKLQAANVPVLWRPLHEAEGGWFWWGARGPTSFVRLWRWMYDRLTRVHGLDNLIWVYTSAGDAGWFPGDDVVDVIGADAYPADHRDPLVGVWSTLRGTFGDRKLLALTEVGFVPDVARMRRHGVGWSYFVTWNEQLGPRGMRDDELEARLVGAGVQENQ